MSNASLHCFLFISKYFSKGLRQRKLIMDYIKSLKIITNVTIRRGWRLNSKENNKSAYLYPTWKFKYMWLQMVSGCGMLALHRILLTMGVSLRAIHNKFIESILHKKPTNLCHKLCVCPCASSWRGAPAQSLVSAVHAGLGLAERLLYFAQWSASRAGWGGGFPRV